MGYGQNAAYFFDNSLMTILILTVRLLWIVFIAAIVTGIVVEVKKRGWDRLWLNLGPQITGHNSSKRDLCAVCREKVSSEWQYCPACSSPLTVVSSNGSAQLQDVVNELQPEQSQDLQEHVSTPEEISSGYDIDKQQEANSRKSRQKSRKKKSSDNQ